jgi:arsenate reductase
MKRVLFLCSANSCRSQMAEAIVNRELGESWAAFSAGAHPAGYVHPMALRVLAEIGIEHNGVSKSMAAFAGQSFDLVMTVCDDSDTDCPVWLGPGKKVHLPFPDPARATGSEDQILSAFRQVRDDMREKVVRELREFHE